ncbi:hypothetical protein [Mesorhizobium sp. B2-8-9]|uniref:hypothetical protein n=1 Tax=Mesorhizobium sp. B2-8-9 TaxID=2589899 RepID=UPI00112EA46C|nr:hypothetical protein [Mesorhizobium sp. B2-8-9]TPI80421.1 hypothetical protein FJ423_12055 [Mesorhizobium sp. B2-8-9]
MKLTGWQQQQRTFRRSDPWRIAASEKNLDGEVNLLIQRFLPGVGMRARATAFMAICDALAAAARMKD